MSPRLVSGCCVIALLVGCSGPMSADAGRDAPTVDSLFFDAGPMPSDSSRLDAIADANGVDAIDAGMGTDAVSLDAAIDATGDAGRPQVDRTSPRLHSFMFTARTADTEARAALGQQLAYLDTRVVPQGRLVVYLHGAGAPTTCGSTAHGQLLASWGFHVVSPCYVSDYGVGNCGNDIAGCRLEAFDGTDHHAFVTIPPADSIERRVVRALRYLQSQHPGGDWGFYLDGHAPRWSHIVISGISHGASTSGVIAQVRAVERAVMLSGPLDTDQPWLARTGMTPADRFWGFTHTGDSQHPGHLEAFESLRLPGTVTTVDGAAAPYGNSHRLRSSAMTTDGHGSTQAGGPSPRDGAGMYVFAPVWRTMYGVR